jgi:hypothetical protein
MKDETYIEPAMPRAPAFLYRRISWGAIFAGLLVTMVIQLTLTMLGVSIGAATVHPMQERNPAEGLGIGSAVWLLLSGLISMFVGACIAGRLSGGPRRADGLLHGLVTWSAATVAMVWMTATATGALLGGLGTLLGGAISKSSSGPGQEAMSSLREQAQKVVPQELSPTGREQGGQQSDQANGNQTPGSLTSLAAQDPELSTALARMESHGGAAASAADRDQVVNLLTTKHGIDQQQASTLVNQWDQRFQQTRAQAEQKTREVGDKAASAVSKGSLWGFIALVLGGAVAAWGGWIGTASLPSQSERVVTAAPA